VRDGEVAKVDVAAGDRKHAAVAAAIQGDERRSRRWRWTRRWNALVQHETSLAVGAALQRDVLAADGQVAADRIVRIAVASAVQVLARDLDDDRTGIGNSIDRGLDVVVRAIGRIGADPEVNRVKRTGGMHADAGEQEQEHERSLRSIRVAHRDPSGQE